MNYTLGGLLLLYLLTAHVLKGGIYVSQKLQTALTPFQTCFNYGSVGQ